MDISEKSNKNSGNKKSLKPNLKKKKSWKPLHLTETSGRLNFSAQRLNRC
jgi:hypothetical protein